MTKKTWQALSRKPIARARASGRQPPEHPFCARQLPETGPRGGGGDATARPARLDPRATRRVARARAGRRADARHPYVPEVFDRALRPSATPCEPPRARRAVRSGLRRIEERASPRPSPARRGAAAAARCSPGACGGAGIPGAAPFVQHLTLWVGFLGAALAAREGRLLALATGEHSCRAGAQPGRNVAARRPAAVATLLLAARLSLVGSSATRGPIAAGVPVWSRSSCCRWPSR